MDCVDIAGHDYVWIVGQQGQRVVAGGCDGETPVAFLHCQGLHEDVGVLPAVGVANAVESGSILDFVVVGHRGRFTEVERRRLACFAMLAGFRSQ